MERATALLLGRRRRPAGAGGRGREPTRICRCRRASRCGATAWRRCSGWSWTTPPSTDILGRLGIALEATDEGWRRRRRRRGSTFQLEEDLIAELGRVYGYDRIPVTHARSAAATRAPLEMAYDPTRVRRLLLDRGWSEAVTYSFVSEELQAAIDPEASPLRLANPLSAELSVMRTSLWPGLLQALRQNLARQQPRVRLFESGLRFRTEGRPASGADARRRGRRARASGTVGRGGPRDGLLRPQGRCGGRAGERRLRRWHHPCPRQHPALHPGKCARMLRDGEPVGWLGSIHPSLAATLDLPSTVQLFELETTALGGAPRPAFAPLSKFPSIRRDLALVVDETLDFEAVRRCASAAAGDLLRELVLFDLYVGEKVDSGRKSLALGLILQATSQTLTDDDVAAVVERVLAALKTEVGAELRA
jgi:phenylalanyl-tRNA synthetase beta chain